MLGHPPDGASSFDRFHLRRLPISIAVLQDHTTVWARQGGSRIRRIGDRGRSIRPRLFVFFLLLDPFCFRTFLHQHFRSAFCWGRACRACDAKTMMRDGIFDPGKDFSTSRLVSPRYSRPYRKLSPDCPPFLSEDQKLWIRNYNLVIYVYQYSRA